MRLARGGGIGYAPRTSELFPTKPMTSSPPRRVGNSGGVGTVQYRQRSVCRFTPPIPTTVSPFAPPGDSGRAATTVATGERAVRSLAAWAPTASLLAGVLAVAAALALARFAPGRWVHEPLHSTVEAVDAIIALGLVAVLALRRHVLGRETADYAWLSASLLAMGVLDLAHACTHVDASFFWSRGLSTLFGGVLAAGVWTGRAGANGRRPPRALVLVTIPIAVALLAAPDAWPTPFGPDLTYLGWARVINVIGGLGYLVAAVYFVRVARVGTGPSRLSPGKGESAIFGAQNLLLGVAGLLFGLSRPWDGAWWLFHGLRLLSCLVALAAAVQVYWRIEETQRGHLQRELEAQLGELDALRGRAPALAGDA